MSSASRTSPKAEWPKVLLQAPGVRLPPDLTMDKQVWGNNDLSVAELGECFRAAHDQLRIAKMEYIHELKAKAKTMEDKLVEADEKRVQQLAKREGLEKDVTRFKGFICATLRSRWVLEEMTAEMISTNVDDDDHIID